MFIRQCVPLQEPFGTGTGPSLSTTWYNSSKKVWPLATLDKSNT